MLNLLVEGQSCCPSQKVRFPAHVMDWSPLPQKRKREFRGAGFFISWQVSDREQILPGRNEGVCGRRTDIL